MSSLGTYVAVTLFFIGVLAAYWRLGLEPKLMIREEYRVWKQEQAEKTRAQTQSSEIRPEAPTIKLDVIGKSQAEIEALGLHPQSSAFKCFKDPYDKLWIIEFQADTDGSRKAAKILGPVPK